VIVPTKYFTTPVEAFQQAGISLVIWANHLMRSCITAMQRSAAQIYRDRSLVDVEPAVAPLTEVFRLQQEAELSAAEVRYLPNDEPEPAIVRLEPARVPRHAAPGKVRSPVGAGRVS
jgi:phosphoenolpyruvate phosphomutase